MGVSQKFHGGLHVPRLDLTADVGAGHPDAVDHPVFHHGAGKSLLPAESLQRVRVSLAPVAEAEVLAADKPGGGIVLYQHVEKRPPWHGVHFLVKGQGHHPLHGEALPKELLPVVGRIDEGRGASQHQRIRMGGKGHDPGAAVILPCQCFAPVKQRGVAYVYPVEKAQGINRLVHWFL